jgi:hypothetical protein
MISFAMVNLAFVLLTNQPWVFISLMTGTDVVNLSHLYNRVLMPFGTPQQLGYCSLLCLNFLLYKVLITKSGTKMDVLAILMLMIILVYTSSFSVLIVFTLILLPYLLFYIIRRPMKIIITVSILLLLVFIFLSLSPELIFRDDANVAKSLSRHYILRLESISAIGDFELVQILFGVGNGQSNQYISGTYSFTVLLTVLLEAGLSGLGLYLFYFSIIILQAGRNIFLINIPLITIVSSMFYQINTDITFYILPIILVYAMRDLRSKVGLVD